MFFYHRFFASNIRKKAASLCFLAILFFLNTSHAGVTMFVNSAEDGPPIEDGKCTLREATASANQSKFVNDDCFNGSKDWEGPDNIIITFSDDVVSLTHLGAGEDNGETGDLDIHVDLNISVKEERLVMINGLYNDRVLDLHGPIIVNLSKLIIANGQPPHEGQALYGGGIRIMHADSLLTLSDSKVILNRLTGSGYMEVAGGGIGGRGYVTFYRSEVNDNLVFSPLYYSQKLGGYEATGAMGGGVALLGEDPLSPSWSFLHAYDSRFSGNIVRQLGPVSWKFLRNSEKMYYTRATEGGGIYGDRAHIHLERVEIANNLVENMDETYGNVRGGAISINRHHSSVTSINSTISSNTIALHSNAGQGRAQGGGIYSPNMSSFIANSTIVFNEIFMLKTEENSQTIEPTAGMKLMEETGMINSILALNFVGENDENRREASGNDPVGFNTGGSNIFGARTGPENAVDIHLFEVGKPSKSAVQAAYKKLSLQPLADNGGNNTLTENPRTHALGSYFDDNKLMYSIAVDRGTNIDSINIDQRGFKRPAYGWSFNKQTDIGAYELNAKP